MKELFQHKLTNSFALWFNHTLMDKGEAYQSVSGELYPVSDDRIDDSYSVYASSFKEWVMDSSFGNVVTGIKDGDDNVYGRGDGIVFDFMNGRVLSPTALTSPVTPLPETYNKKEINVYNVNDDEDDLVVDRSFEFGVSATGAIAPYDLVVPAAFISVNGMENEPLAFGGEQMTKTTITATILTDDPYQLDGVLSIFADSKNEIFAGIPMSGNPVDENGDLKGGLDYTYTGVVAGIPPKYFYVEDVTTSKLKQKTKKKVADELYVGFIDFDVTTNRFRFS